MNRNSIVTGFAPDRWTPPYWEKRWVVRLLCSRGFRFLGKWLPRRALILMGFALTFLIGFFRFEVSYRQ